MKNRNKKILQFPTPPEEPVLTTVIFQVGSTRFAMHWSIENLPPAEPLLRLVPQVNKTTKRICSPESPAAEPEDSKPSRARARTRRASRIDPMVALRNN